MHMGSYNHMGLGGQGQHKIKILGEKRRGDFYSFHIISGCGLCSRMFFFHEQFVSATAIKLSHLHSLSIDKGSFPGPLPLCKSQISTAKLAEWGSFRKSCLTLWGLKTKPTETKLSMEVIAKKTMAKVHPGPQERDSPGMGVSLALKGHQRHSFQSKLWAAHLLVTNDTNEETLAQGGGLS